jgi:competence protein ComEC
VLRKFPLLLPVLGFALGTWAYQHGAWLVLDSVQIFAGISFLIIFSIFILYFKRLRFFRGHIWMLAIFFVMLGWLRNLVVDPLQHPTHYAHHVNEGVANVFGTLERELKRTASGNRWEVALSFIEIDSVQFQISGSVLMVFKELENELKPGYEIVASGKFQGFPPAAFPGAFDYGQFMAANDVYRHFYADRIFVANDTEPHAGLMILASRVRAKVLEALGQMDLSEESRALAAALLVGYRDWVDEDHRSNFAAAGTMHVLAVSGLHVGIVYVVLVFLLGLNRSPFGRWWKIPILLSAIWFYAFVAGLSPSVMRAAAMFSFFAIGQAFKRGTNSYNMMLAAAALLLWLNPKVMFSVGFQLSYAAVWGIVSLVPLLQKLWQPQNKVLHKVRDLLFVSLAAQLATLPFTAYYFQQFPTWFLLGNLLVLPIIPVVMYVGGLSVLAVSFGFYGANWFVIGFGWLLDAVNLLTKAIGQLPCAVSNWPLLRSYWYFLLMALILALPWAFKQLNSKRLIIVGACTIALYMAFLFEKWHQSTSQELMIFKDHKSICVAHKQGHHLWISNYLSHGGRKFVLEPYAKKVGALKVHMPAESEGGQEWQRISVNLGRGQPTELSRLADQRIQVRIGEQFVEAFDLNLGSVVIRSAAAGLPVCIQTAPYSRRRFF